MPTDITLDLLTAATSPGGSSCLAFTTELAPAGGWHTTVAPAKYVRGNDAVYAYERRYLDGEERDAVVLDSKQSTNNRLEEQVALALERGERPLASLPRILVTYQDGRTFSDLTLPHRFADGHIRAGSIGGVPTTQTDEYRALRDATPANASSLLNRSPLSLLLGSWDASRKAKQGRWRSVLVGEVIGFLPGGAHDEPRRPASRGGARVDPVGMQVKLDGPSARALLAGQRDELSTKNVDDFTKRVDAATKPGGKPVSGSPLGLGGIPPSLEQLAGVACDRIIRSRVLSFAALRQIRFGTDPDADVAARTLLAALALSGIARADAELLLRANCDLREAGPSTATLDLRGGELLDVRPLGIADADALLASALQRARDRAGVIWDGSVLDVVGNPSVITGAADDESDQS